MSDFGFYSGQELFEKQFTKRDYLIDQILHEKDSVILAGKAKTGKSVLLFQLICSLTSGQPFLGQFEVKRKCRVLYIQLEGSLADSQDRFIRMRQALSLENENLFLMFSSPLPLNDEGQMREVIAKIEYEMAGIVDVIIIDPIYFAMSGSLSDDESVRDFTGQLRILQDRFNCAIILAHHFKKARRDKDGNIQPTGDDDVFGSVFFQAWITHQFLFDLDKVNETRILQCNVQRSGKIMDKICLRLIEPEPLLFKVLDHFPTVNSAFDKVFEENPDKKYTRSNIQQVLRISKATFYREIKKLMAEGKIDRVLNESEYLYFKKQTIT